MKTRITLFLIACAFAVNSNAQILNSSFEDWTNNGLYSDPDHWYSLNYLTAPNGTIICEEGTPGNPGSKYVKLISRMVTGAGVISGTITSGDFDFSTSSYTQGFAYSQRPASLTGVWQYAPGTNDQGFAYVMLTKWNPGTMTADLIAINSTALPPGNVTTWTNFDLPLAYISNDTPDTVIISFSSSGSAITPVDGSYLYLDNLAFAGSASGINTLSPPLMVELYPNPASDYFYILKSTPEKETRFEISSVDGKIVQKGILKSAKTKIEVPDLAKGVYFVNVFNEGNKTSRRLVVN
ncbi:MAG: T9SS type A sorting domain-containing protein [Bacteroidota bacterium]